MQIATIARMDRTSPLATNTAESKSKRDVSSTLPRLERVLVATDFSMNAEDAVERAALLPLATSAHVQLLHVVTRSSPEAVELRRADESLEVQRERLSKASHRETVARRVVGDARSEIIHAARAQGAELVVLGAHSGRDRILRLGSTARDVIRRGSSPVLVVKARPVRPYARPLVALDRSDVANMVLETAIAVVDENVRLRVVHAFHVPFEGYVATSSSRGELEAFRRHYRNDARRRMASLVGDERACRLAITVRRGDASTVITHEIGLREADLVVVGTHGRTGLSELFLGSVAQWTLESAPCDVLVGRPERFALDQE